MTIPWIQRKLAESHPAVVPIYAAIVAFCTYSCMYAFRKPFTAATFDNLFFLGLKYKDVLIIAQLIGYTLSKFLGIKIIAEMKLKNRGWNIIKLIGIAAVSLLFFALIPSPYNIIFLFMNGIPLGMVWGIVFSYLEGRKTTEFMGSIMAVSLIFSSGFVKSTGKWLLKTHSVSQWWMPLEVGLIFLGPMIIFIFLLEQIPEPTFDDIENRTERKPMSNEERKDFIKSYLPGIIAVIIAYVSLTIMRDFRDNFAADIWKELGNGDASIFTETEIPVSLIILLSMSLLILIKNNLRALQVNHIIVCVGFILSGASTFLFTHQLLPAFWWMVLNGIGLYLGYVPFNVVFFERKIAAIRRPANVGFLMYTADSFGYMGSIGIMLFKNASNSVISYSKFFIDIIYLGSFSGIVFMITSLIYLNRKIKSAQNA